MISRISSLLKPISRLRAISNNAFKISSLLIMPYFHFNQVKSYAQQNNIYQKITFSSKYMMAKKKEDKKTQKQKQKQKIKEQIGEVKQIDLNKFEEPYKRIVQNYKLFLAKCRAGKLDASSFDDVQVKVGKDKLAIQHLAQIAPKSTISVVINPYDSDNLDLIQKAIKASDSSYQVLKIEKYLSVSLPNSSIKDLKQKMVEKVKKSLNDQKQHLKKQRHNCQQQLKKYKKVAQQDKLRTIQKQAKDLFDKYTEILQKLMKEKQKQLLK